MKAVKPKKNLGQHFLTDLNIAKRIADTVDACPDIPVLEIGPGMGVLTQYLVEKPRPVKAVEIDSESVAYLHENFPTLKDNIIGEDFLRMVKYTLKFTASARNAFTPEVLLSIRKSPRGPGETHGKSRQRC